ncbi:unnamed protein product, partial [marine sediment metagenome]
MKVRIEINKKTKEDKYIFDFLGYTLDDDRLPEYVGKRAVTKANYEILIKDLYLIQQALIQKKH